MRFEESKYFSKLSHYKLEFSFGNFYFFENFVVSEINESIHFCWDKILEVIGALIDYYGEKRQIVYISNRVNSYSIEPQLWHRFYDEFDFILATVAVVYNDFGYISATIEKQFIKNSFYRCNSLEEAINWMKHLEMFSQN